MRRSLYEIGEYLFGNKERKIRTPKNSKLGEFFKMTA
jgi:hypothetical protein